MIANRIDWSQLKPRKRIPRWLQFGLAALLVLILLIQVFMWLQPDQTMRAWIASKMGVEWCLIATYAGFFLLFTVIVGLAQQIRPGIAFIIFSGLLVFAIFWTVVVYYESKDRPTWKEATESGLHDNPSWISQQVFLHSVPGVWLLVVGGGLGLGISTQEHPDL